MRADVRRLVAESVNSGMRRSEFLPESLQHAGSPSEEAAVEEADEVRSRRWQVWGRWSWP